MAKKAKAKGRAKVKAKRGPVKQVRAKKAAVAAKRAAAVKKARAVSDNGGTAVVDRGEPDLTDEALARTRAQEFGDDVSPEGRLPDFVTRPPVQEPEVRIEGGRTFPVKKKDVPVEEQVGEVPAHLQDPPTGGEAPSVPPPPDDTHGTENDPAALAAKAARMKSTQERLKEENRARQERNAKLRR